MDNRFKKNNWVLRNYRSILLFLYALVFLMLSIFIIYKGLDVVKTKDITYINNSDIDYQVYLKENDYFDEPYLNKGEKYIASLIDRIHIIYNYNLTSYEEMSGEYTYHLVATILVKEKDKDSILWENDYDLSNKQSVSFNKQTVIAVSDEVDISYDYYNDIVNSFKKDYGVPVDANLMVKLVVETNAKDDGKDFTITQEPFVSIPLSEQTLEIDFSVVENDINTDTITYTKYPWLNHILLVIGIIFVIIYLFIGFVGLFRMIRSIKKRNKYDVFLRKIFSNYDQIIIDTDKIPDLDNIDILEVSSFEELVDAQNEIHKPIIFNEVKKGHEAVFVLMDSNHAYRYTVLVEDLVK